MYMIPILGFITTLTAFATDNLDLGTPSQGGQVVDRKGYAFCYSEKHEQALWVSYKLTKGEVIRKVAKRKDNFRADPLIKTGSSSLADYRGSGYDRGHLAPAADMAWSKKAMSESFYLTNMSPQIAGLNRGMWKNLESYVRNWAVDRGSVYVITGPVIRPNYLTIGANKVTVPQWYYKIVVDTARKQAIAFIIPNRKPQKDLSEFAGTIDKVEAVTGLDFCSKLNDYTEDKIESQLNLDQWKFSSSRTYKTTTYNKQKKPSTTAINTYWVTKSSKKRHNSKCRYYKKSKGHYGTKGEGIACKVCGG